MTCAQLRIQPNSTQKLFKYEALLCKVGRLKLFVNLHSNEKMPKTKVVDLEKLNKNGINFFLI